MPSFLSLIVSVIAEGVSTLLFSSETAEPVQFFMTDSDFRDFVTFISCLPIVLSDCVIFCIINSITGLIHFNVCGVFVDSSQPFRKGAQVNFITAW